MGTRKNHHNERALLNTQNKCLNLWTNLYFSYAQKFIICLSSTWLKSDKTQFEKYHYYISFLAGTGNVLKVQQLLHLCSEHDEKKDQVATHHSCLHLGCIFDVEESLIGGSSR